jgi:hypothetical protein
MLKQWQSLGLPSHPLAKNFCGYAHWKNLFAALAADFPVKSHLGFLPH